MSGLSIQVRSWGNSLGIRLPKSVANKMGINESDTLDLIVKDNALIIKKQFPHRTFEERLAEYDGKISVLDYEWGEPVGKEMI